MYTIKEVVNSIASKNEYSNNQARLLYETLYVVKHYIPAPIIDFCSFRLRDSGKFVSFNLTNYLIFRAHAYNDAGSRRSEYEAWILWNLDYGLPSSLNQNTDERETHSFHHQPHLSTISMSYREILEMSQDDWGKFASACVELNERKSRRWETNIVWEKSSSRKVANRSIETVYTEGRTVEFRVSRYERSPDARKKCLEHYGLNCCVCGFNFEAKYGTIGKDFIEVHHIIPISEHDTVHQIDPIKDLRPVCSNCHRMLHRKSPPYSIEELKVTIESQGGKPE